MCRLCSQTVESTRASLQEISDRLSADEYDIHSLPVDLRLSFHALAELARTMHLSDLDRDIEALSRAVLDQVEPLHADLLEAASGVHS